MGKRTNQSKNPKMAKWVKAYDVYRSNGGHLNVKEYHRKKKILETDGIPYKSYWEYVRTDDVNKRKKTIQQRAEEEQMKHGTRMREYYDRLNRINVCEGRLYYLPAISFCFETPATTPMEKKCRYELMKKELPKICDNIKADDSFLEIEYDWLDWCNETYGANEALYIPPQIGKESGRPGDENTRTRRKRMCRRVDAFKAAQARHAMSMVNSGAGRKNVLIALDHFIGKFDGELQAKGLEPSGLRWQLREVNHSRAEELKKRKEGVVALAKAWDATKRDTVNHKGKPMVDDLDISRSERQAAFTEMREEILAQENRLVAQDFEESEYMHNMSLSEKMMWAANEHVVRTSKDSGPHRLDPFLERLLRTRGVDWRPKDTDAINKARREAKKKMKEKMEEKVASSEEEVVDSDDNADGLSEGSEEPTEEELAELYV